MIDPHEAAVSPKGPWRPRRLSPPAVAGLAGLALVFAAGGCGSGNSANAHNGSTAAKQAPAPAALTQAQFVAKANAICSSGDPALSALTFKLAASRSRSEAAHLVASDFVPAIKTQISEIKALGAPAGAQATIATMLHLIETDVRKVELQPALAGPRAFTDFAKVAHSFGLTACAPLS